MSQIQSVLKIDFLNGEFIKSRVKVGYLYNFLFKSNFKYVVLTNLRLIYVDKNSVESLQLNGVDYISLSRRKKFWRGVFWLAISIFSAMSVFLYFENIAIAFFAFIGIIFAGIYLFFDHYALNREVIFSIRSKSGELDVIVDSENYYKKILGIAKEIAYSCPDAVYSYKTLTQDVSQDV